MSHYHIIIYNQRSDIHDKHQNLYQRVTKFLLKQMVKGRSKYCMGDHTRKISHSENFEISKAITYNRVCLLNSAS